MTLRHKRLGVWLLSTAWSCASALVRLLIQFGILKPACLPVRVVSVGNLQAGGAGKTPLVAKIANEAHERGLRVGILCRGYRSGWENGGGILEPGLESAPVLQCGDEPALLHQLCPHAWIGVGADRKAQFYQIQQRVSQPLDLVILDDGLQHWRLKKDLEIVAWTSRKRWEMLFRDFPSVLKRTNLIVWTKGDEPPTQCGVPCVHVRYDLGVSQLEKTLFWLVTGIADGKSACELAVKSGLTLVRFTEYEDHKDYTQIEVRELLKQAAAEGWQVALTGKDWVKWAALGVSATEVFVLEPKVVFVTGKKEWDRVLWAK